MNTLKGVPCQGGIEETHVFRERILLFFLKRGDFCAIMN